MKILLASMELSSITGQPMYTYNLAKGLKELGHEVTCVGLHTGGPMKDMFESLGVRIMSIQATAWRGKYDFVLIGENIPEYLTHIECNNTWNICHSKNDADKPIIDDRIKGYIAPREQISNYWKESFDIDFEIVPIPIDFNKFRVEKEPQLKYTILAPCGRCELRKPMLMDLLKRAEDNPNIQVWMVGDDYGAFKRIKEFPPNVSILPATMDIVPFMRKADEVAGIFIGTVTIEAWIMGVETSVYDEEGNWEFVDPPEDLEQYNYKNIANKICNLMTQQT